MKTIQRLELFAGTATFITALLAFIFVLFPSIKDDGNVSAELRFFWCIVFFVLPEFLIALGSYVHAVNRSIAGFFIILIFSVPLILVYALSATTSVLFSDEIPFKSLLGLSPALFAAATVILALYLTIFPTTRSKNIELH